jgi:membrane associated rhomboid family serine protease
VPTYFKNKGNPAYNALGASGGVAAVVFASILFEPIRLLCFYFVLCLPGFILGAIYFIYSYFKGRGSRDNINHDAHLYGALFGLVFCIILYPASIVNFFDQLANLNFIDQIKQLLN